MPETPERFLSAKEAAAFLSVSVAFIYKWVATIPHLKIGGARNGKLLFRASELAAWAERQRAVPLLSQKVSA